MNKLTDILINGKILSSAMGNGSLHFIAAPPF
jgi:hypothetical protein